MAEGLPGREGGSGKTQRRALYGLLQWETETGTGHLSPTESQVPHSVLHPSPQTTGFPHSVAHLLNTVLQFKETAEPGVTTSVQSTKRALSLRSLMVWIVNYFEALGQRFDPFKL